MDHATGHSAAQPTQAEHKPAPYLTVFVALAVLTAVEVWVVPMLGFPKIISILALLFLAIWKAVMVALYYMHLRYEPNRLRIMTLVPLPLAIILLLAVLTEF